MIKTFSNDLSRLKESNTNDNTVILNNKSSNKNLKIECSYYCSNKNNYNISGDKYIKKKKHYISSVPCSTRKNIQKNMNSNTNTSIKKEKDLIGGGSSKKTYGAVNSSLATKFKNKIKPLLRGSLYKNNENNNLYQKGNKTKVYTKRIIDNSSYNLPIPKTTRRAGNESILDKTASNCKNNSELYSFDFEGKKDNNKKYSKINNIRKENEKLKAKIFSKNEGKFKSIKVNKNNCLDKESKTTLNSINNSSKNNLNLNKKVNSTNNTYKKSKTRLQSCKFSNQQAYELQKRKILENNNLKNAKKISEKENEKKNNFKFNQSSSTKERKNITFFNNYMKHNNLYTTNKSNLNQKKHYYTKSNISSNVNNNSAVIRNTNTNINNLYSKDTNTSNKKIQ